MLTLCGGTLGYTEPVLACLSWASCSVWASPQHSLQDILGAVASVVDLELARHASAHVILWHMVYCGAEEMRTHSKDWDLCVIADREKKRLLQLRDDLWREEDREQLRDLALTRLRAKLHAWFRRCVREMGHFAALAAVRELMVYGISPIEDASEAAADGWNYLEDALPHVPEGPIREVVRESLARWSSELRARWAASRV